MANAADKTHRGPRQDRLVLVACAVVLLIIAWQTWQAIWQGDAIFMQAYLQAFVFWIGFPLGALFFLALHQITGGRWGHALRPALTSSAATLPVMALLFFPIFIGLSLIYAWVSSPGSGQNDHLVNKALYLNTAFFGVRAIFYFIVWVIFARKLMVIEEEASRQPGVGAAGIVLLFLTASFAAIDWMMSLDGRWFSSVYSLIVMASQALSGLALAIATISYWQHKQNTRDASLGLDIGNMMLANVLAWTYLNFSQLIIMWSANESRQMIWYALRNQNGWNYLAWFLIVTAFAAPFFLLLFRSTKQSPRRLMLLAIWIIITQCLANYWFVVPGFLRPSPGARWVDLWLLIAIGMLWGLSYGAELRRARRLLSTFPAPREGEG